RIRRLLRRLRPGRAGDPEGEARPRRADRRNPGRCRPPLALPSHGGDTPEYGVDRRPEPSRRPVVPTRGYPGRAHAATVRPTARRSAKTPRRMHRPARPDRAIGTRRRARAALASATPRIGSPENYAGKKAGRAFQPDSDRAGRSRAGKPT